MTRQYQLCRNGRDWWPVDEVSVRRHVAKQNAPETTMAMIALSGPEGYPVGSVRYRIADVEA